jgi:hypothetical protein
MLFICYYRKPYLLNRGFCVCIVRIFFISPYHTNFKIKHHHIFMNPFPQQAFKYYNFDYVYRTLTGCVEHRSKHFPATTRKYGLLVTSIIRQLFDTLSSYPGTAVHVFLPTNLHHVYACCNSDIE